MTPRPYPSSYRRANRSYFNRKRDEKTCPRCSIRANERVFKKWPDEFPLRADAPTTILDGEGAPVGDVICAECQEKDRRVA